MAIKQNAPRQPPIAPATVEMDGPEDEAGAAPVSALCPLSSDWTTVTVFTTETVFTTDVNEGYRLKLKYSRVDIGTVEEPVSTRVV